MLINVEHVSVSSFNENLKKYIWKEDEWMTKQLASSKLNQIKHIPTQYEGIFYSHLNPSLTIDPCYSIKDHFKYFETNSKVDKRNRKFNKILNNQAVKWYDYSFEELEAMSESEKDLARKPIKNLFYAFKSHVLVDNVEQFYSYFKFLKDLDKDYIAFLTPIYKSKQPESGGFRWHKWGEYLGTQKQTNCEYLYDEPHIDLIFVANVYEVKSLVLETLLTDLFNIYLLKDSVIFKDKENKIIAKIINETSKDNTESFSILGNSNTEHGIIYKYPSIYQNHLEEIIEDVTDLYNQYLKNGLISPKSKL